MARGKPINATVGNAVADMPCAPAPKAFETNADHMTIAVKKRLRLIALDSCRGGAKPWQRKKHYMLRPPLRASADVSAEIALNRIAIMVGVTGHRDIVLALEEPLRAEFSAILSELRQDYEFTPLVVLSTLSEGAGILCAEVALDRGIPVVACLPMDPDEYANELATPEARSRFSALLGKCARIEIASNAATRSSRYFEAGMYVANYSHILVALWDGLQSEDEGATADIVGIRASGVAADERGLTNLPGPPDVGPIYHIPTPRGASAPTAGPISRSKQFPERFSGDRGFEADFNESLTRLDQFNRDLTLAERSSPPTRTIEEMRDRTSEVANALQRTTFRFLYGLYFTALVATAVQYTTNQALKFVMFPVAFLAYRVAKRFDYENRYQDYRALSEGLRVQCAWFCAGLRIEQAERSYLGMQHRELQWIRLALRYTHIVFLPVTSDGRVDDPGCRTWIDDQRVYFQTSARREAHALKNCKLGSQTTFWVAVAISFLLFAYLYLPTASHLAAQALTHVAAAKSSRASELAEQLTGFARSLNALQGAVDSSALINSHWYSSVHQWDLGSRALHLKPHHGLLVRLSTGFLALYAAIALLISNYCDKRGFALNVKRYDRMFAVFDRAKARLDAMADPNSAPGRELVRELGRAALIENADWLLMRRERPLAFVT